MQTRGHINSSSNSIGRSPTVPCHRATSATVAARKVCPFIWCCNPDVDAPAIGHWIQDCPTNNDRDFDHRPRIKRTTGIPRSFLKAVENPTDAQGVMVTPEGGFVVAQPDS